MLEFDSTTEEPPPVVETCVVYDGRSGRIISMHQFIGDGTGLFGPEGTKERERMALDTVREQHREVGESDRRVMHAPPDFRPEPMTVYRVDPATNRLVTHASHRDLIERLRMHGPNP
jgi:hypothetical protein